LHRQTVLKLPRTMQRPTLHSSIPSAVNLPMTNWIMYPVVDAAVRITKDLLLQNRSFTQDKRCISKNPDIPLVPVIVRILFAQVQYFGLKNRLM